MIWTLLCLQPYLILAVPFIVVLFCLLVPSFLQLHPPPPSNIPLPPDLDAWSTSTGRAKKFGGTAEGRDFLLNMRDIQNSMDDFTKAYDKVSSTVNSYVNFVDEKRSSVVLCICVVGGLITVTAAAYIPVRFLALLLGWLLLMTGNTTFSKLLLELRRFTHNSSEAVMHSVGKQVDDEYIDPQMTPEMKMVVVYEYRNESGEPFYSGFSTIGNAGNEDEYITNNIETVLPPPGYAFVERNKWTVVGDSQIRGPKLIRTTLRRNVIRSI